MIAPATLPAWYFIHAAVYVLFGYILKTAADEIRHGSHRTDD